MRAKKALGQHFLSDRGLLGRIADALDPAADDHVLEIGPGPGGLTAELLARCRHVAAIEKDEAMLAPLRARFPALTLHHGDALALDWPAASGVTAAPGAGRVPGWLVCGNIPYNITSPLLDKALAVPRPARIVFLVQKEVAARVTATPGTGAYGALSIGVQAVARAERLFPVPAGAFRPPPRVDSAVLRLTPLAEPLLPDAEAAGFRRFTVGLFGFRRKQLGRGLRELCGLDAATARAACAAAALDPDRRPETLSPEEAIRLHRVLVDGLSGNR